MATAPPRGRTLANWFRRILVMLILVTVGTGVVFAGFIYGLQRKMIYLPMRYEPSYARGLPKGTVEVEFSTSDGRQVAFYVPPRKAPKDGACPARLWVLFSGNASLALDWLDFVEQYPDEDTAFLLADYPGYGICAGSPSAGGIRRSVAALLPATAAAVGCDAGRLSDRLNVMGFSIGCAAALEFAVLHRPNKLVLISPFTSLGDMARLTVGWPLSMLCSERLDNRARLDEVAGQSPAPSVSILHGDADNLVPFAQGRELAGRHPGLIQFFPVGGATHDTVLDIGNKQILAIMTGAAK